MWPNQNGFYQRRPFCKLLLPSKPLKMKQQKFSPTSGKSVEPFCPTVNYPPPTVGGLKRKKPDKRCVENISPVLWFFENCFEDHGVEIYPSKCSNLSASVPADTDDDQHVHEHSFSRTDRRTPLHRDGGDVGSETEEQNWSPLWSATLVIFRNTGNGFGTRSEKPTTDQQD